MSLAQYSTNDTTWGDEYYEYKDDEYYFPEDYYYEYPNDYYSNSYYRDFYQDYRRSILRVNWDNFFYEFNLSPNQIRLIIDLNNQFDTYYTWESYYRTNPVRWYYDRFYALERILGSRLYVIFQNRYYRRVRPVVYYNNRCRNFYNVRYQVRPAYRHYNINRYRVDRYNYHQNIGRRYGWRQQQNNNGFRRTPTRNYSNRKAIRFNSGFRNQSNNTRNNNSFRTQKSTSTRNNGFRNSTKKSQMNTPIRLPSDSGFRKSTSSSRNRSANNRTYKSNRTSSSVRKATDSRNPNGNSFGSSSVRSYRR